MAASTSQPDIFFIQEAIDLYNLIQDNPEEWWKLQDDLYLFPLLQNVDPKLIRNDFSKLEDLYALYEILTFALSEEYGLDEIKQRPTHFKLRINGKRKNLYFWWNRDKKQFLASTSQQLNPYIPEANDLFHLISLGRRKDWWKLQDDLHLYPLLKKVNLKLLRNDFFKLQDLHKVNQNLISALTAVYGHDSLKKRNFLFRLKIKGRRRDLLFYWNEEVKQFEFL